MKAYWTPDGGSLIQLAGSDTTGYFDQPQAVQMTGDGAVVQSANIIRATKPKRYDRGNATRSISFAVTVNYDTWDLAVAGNATLLAQLVGIGVFLLKNAADSTILTINQAKVTMVADAPGTFASRQFTIEGTA